ncbi:MAG: hypothetical protein L7T26_14200 [Pseudomonadales bacterium]|nr:hypothetical protein [Pseudomonadales bacterium]
MKRNVFLIQTLFLVGIVLCGRVEAEPLLMLGGFRDEGNALAYQARLGALLQEPVRLVTDDREGQPYYRVVLVPRGRSLVVLKQQVAEVGVTDVWTWSPSVSPGLAPANSSEQVLTRASAVSEVTSQSGSESVSNSVSKVRTATVKARPSTVVSSTSSSTPMQTRRFQDIQTHISGYLKTYGVAQAALRTDFFSLGEIYQSQSSGRLMVESFSDSVVFQMHYELSPLSVSRSLGADSLTYRIVGDGYRWSDLEASLSNSEGSKTQLYQNLDRFNVQIQTESYDVTIGRQAIAFGSARFINPIDVFLPFNLRTFNTEYRTGVDAIRVQRAWGDLGEIDVGLVFGADADPETSAAFLQLRNNVAGKDFNFSLIEYAEQTLVGGGMQSELGSLGFWLEAAYVDGESNYVRASTGVDYAFNEVIFGMVEYHFNGAGSRQSEDYLSLYETQPYQRGGVFLLGERYVIPSLAVQVSPLLSFSVQGIFNLEDNSNYTMLSAEYNVAENVYMDFGAYVFSGRGLMLSPQQSLMLGSEYGANPNMLYASLRWYF